MYEEGGEKREREVEDLKVDGLQRRKGCDSGLQGN